MTKMEKSRVKNAPLISMDERSDFVEWATSIPDGSISAGWQPLDLEQNRDYARALEIPALDDNTPRTA